MKSTVDDQETPNYRFNIMLVRSGNVIGTGVSGLMDEYAGLRYDEKSHNGEYGLHKKVCSREVDGKKVQQTISDYRQDSIRAYNTVNSSVFKVDGFVVCIDPTEENVSEALEQVLFRVTKYSDSPIVIAVTKSDLGQQVSAAIDKIREFAKEHDNIPVFLTSAKNSEVSEPFDQLTKQMINLSYTANTAANDSDIRHTKKRRISLSELGKRLRKGWLGSHGKSDSAADIKQDQDDTNIPRK